MTGLTALSITDQKLASFDGTGMSSLQTLTLTNNKLTSFDGT